MSRLDELLALLACPRCRRPLSAGLDVLRCELGHDWPVVDGIPVFTEAGRDIERRPFEHQSHQAPGHLVDRLDATGGTWLHLGAGATSSHEPRAIELETAIFRHTDVVGDAGSLPFADGALTGVLALNVFEHLPDPAAAALELHRVTRPGGLVIIQTAFLQPLHADPDHYYNATESGLRAWFRDFDIDVVEVPENFNPAYAVSWIVSDILFHATAAQRDVLADATLAEVAKIWREPAARSGALYEAFAELPAGVRRATAAGFQLLARRR